MTELESGVLSAVNGVGEVIDLAKASTAPHEVVPGLFAVVVPSGGYVKEIDAQEYLDKYADNPPRKVGTFAVHDADSFVAYLGKHALPHTEVWADTTRARIVGVINAHMGNTLGADLAGHADHRVTFDVQPTDAWKAWLALDGKLLTQSDFAEHIEDRAIDVVLPTAAAMLELAQTFQATIGVKFESSKSLSSGERQLEYRETVDAKAGRAGAMDIPKDFTLALTPFEGASAYKVIARLRYRITEGTLRIGYKLERPEDVRREAFLDVVKAIDAGTEAPVLRGVSA